MKPSDKTPIRKLLFLCIGICYFFTLSAQSLDAERIFLAPQKEVCMPGDTLRIAGQLIAANHKQFFPTSQYIYIECIGKKDSVLLRQKVVCDPRGYFQTILPTDVKWDSKLYYLRAYTQLMQNYAPESFTVIPLLLGAVQPEKRKIAREVYAQIFPEGGRLINGFRQNVVFHLTDDHSYPVIPSHIRLLDAQKDTIIKEITVSENGLGKFTFLPQTGQQYRMLVEYNNRMFSFPVKTEATGTAMQAILNRERLSYQVFTNETQPLHLFLYHAETGLQELPFPTSHQAVISLANYPKGLYTLFLTDDHHQLLNERILWKTQEETGSFDCFLPKTIMPPNTPLNYRLQVPDSSVVFTRIVPQNDLMATQAYPTLQWGNEIDSPIRLPLQDSKQWNEMLTEINHWLFTARFKLFSVTNVLTEGMHFHYPIENVMLLAGTAWKEKHVPLDSGSLITATNMQEQIYYTTETNEKGRFILPVDNYSTGTQFRISAQNKKGEIIDCSFTWQESTYPQVVIPYPIFQEIDWETEYSTDDTQLRYSINEKQEKVYHIDNVTVQSHKRVNKKEADRTPINFIGPAELQQRAGLSIRSVLTRFPTIVIRSGTRGGGDGILAKYIRAQRAEEERNRVIQEGGSEMIYAEIGIFWRNDRDARLSNTIGNQKLTVIVDDEVVFNDVEYILNQPAGIAESIEILKPNDIRCTRYNAQAGAVLIKTRHGIDYSTKEQTSQTIIEPLGLTIAQPQQTTNLQSPSIPGHYLLLIDVITKNKQVESFCREFEVKDTF